MSDEPKKILLVEDDKVLSEVLKEALVINSFDVVIAEQAKDAIFKVENQKFDIIITDFNLGKSDATAFIQTAQSPKAINKKTPIILISGQINKDEFLDIKGYLYTAMMKPLKPELLVAKIIELTEK